MAQDKYIIGNGLAPSWCRHYLTPYKKRDGSTGYEYAGRFKTFELSKGDILEMETGVIRIRKKEWA